MNDAFIKHTTIAFGYVIAAVLITLLVVRAVGA